MDLEKAVLDPSSVFTHPQEVYGEQSLDRAQKIRILRRWEYDARELAVAEEENMAGGPPDLLHDILIVLHRLGAEVDLEHAPPTKQGGE